MPYIENRSVHDADAHVVETPDWLHAFADPAVREPAPAALSLDRQARARRR